MAKRSVIGRYLAQLRCLLPLARPWKSRVLTEVREHLVEAMDAELAVGTEAAQAERRAIERFGSPALIARLYASTVPDHSPVHPPNVRGRTPNRVRGRRSHVERNARPPETRVRRCAFCGKTQEQVRRLIAGPNDVHICNECVGLCNDILAKEEGHPTPA